jgi:hypothetical protein
MNAPDRAAPWGLPQEGVLATMRAGTPFGAVSLGLPSPVPLDAAGSALAIERCEPLLRALEDWLGCAIDPHPVDGEHLCGAGLRGVALDDRLAPDGTVCHLPWAALAGRAPPELLRDRIAWDRLEWDLEIARYAQAPMPTGITPSGGVLLLPPSFTGSLWKVQARERRAALSIELDWDRDRHVFIAAGRPRTAKDDPPSPPAWHVRLDTLPGWPTDFMLGWRDAGQPVRAIGVLASLRDAEGRVRMRGGIVPALGGAALMPFDLDPDAHAAPLASAGDSAPSLPPQA